MEALRTGLARGMNDREDKVTGVLYDPNLNPIHDRGGQFDIAV